MTTTDTRTPSTDITVLKHLTALRLDVSIWTARRKLTPADFGASHLPPEKLASLGSKKVCNPEDLRIFGTLKARAVSMLDRHGVRFLGGWAIPEAKATSVVRDLTAIGAAFGAAKRDFLARYHQAVKDWIAANPGWESLIAGSVVDADVVRSRLSFGWQLFKVAPPKSRSRDADDSLVREVGGLAATLLDEIARAARASWASGLEGRDEISRKALFPIRAMMAKLDGLSFIEPRIAPIVSLMQTGLETLPAKGTITGANAAMLQGLVRLAMDSDALLVQGSRILDGAECRDVLVELAGTGSVSNPEEESSLPEESDMEAVDGSCLDSLGLW